MKSAREPASSRPKPCASLKKPHESCPFAAPCGPRRKKNDRGQRSAFPPQKPPGSRLQFSRTRVHPSSGSSTIELPSAFAESSAYPPDREQAHRDSAPCLSRAATLPKATKLELGRGAHLKTPSSANHTAAASQPTGRMAKAASYLHLSRMSPVLHPPERPSHTHAPKPVFFCMDRLCKEVINPARGQLNRKNEYFPVPVHA